VRERYGDGTVGVRRYPAVVKAAPRLLVKAHAGAVAHVKFSCDGKRLLSLGQTDRCLLVWKVWSPAEPLSADATADGGLRKAALVAASRGGGGAGPASAAQSANGLVGLRVVVHGLTERPHLNGSLGVVTAFSAAGGGGGSGGGKAPGLAAASAQPRYTVRPALRTRLPFIFLLFFPVFPSYFFLNFSSSRFLFATQPRAPFLL
jgi:hypothetical protein